MNSINTGTITLGIRPICLSEAKMVEIDIQHLQILYTDLMLFPRVMFPFFEKECFKI